MIDEWNPNHFAHFCILWFTALLYWLLISKANFPLLTCDLFIVLVVFLTIALLCDINALLISVCIENQSILFPIWIWSELNVEKVFHLLCNVRRIFLIFSVRLNLSACLNWTKFNAETNGSEADTCRIIAQKWIYVIHIA